MRFDGLNSQASTYVNSEVALNRLTKQSSITSIVSGTKTVTTAGTPVQFSATSIPIYGVWVNADLLAGTVVTVGDSGVVGNASGMKGLILTPGNPPIFLPITDLNMLWVDAQANGGKLSVLYYPV